MGNSICVPWDDNVSRVHAELVRVGAEWVVADDGVSRNGSYVNGDRVHGRRRLRDGDALRTGRTAFVFRAPQFVEGGHTAPATELPTAATLTPAQRRVLIALARPYATATGFVTPATNSQIAEELVLSIDAIKTHLRALGVKFGVEGLPQNQKRARLVERAFATGVLSQRDLM